MIILIHQRKGVGVNTDQRFGLAMLLAKRSMLIHSKPDRISHHLGLRTVNSSASCRCRSAVCSRSSGLTRAQARIFWTSIGILKRHRRP